jgi:predicted ArsR family transcriptional regulator
MSRPELVYQFLASQNDKVSSRDIAAALGLTRAQVTCALVRLNRSRRIMSTAVNPRDCAKGQPSVLYYLPPPEETDYMRDWRDAAMRWIEAGMYGRGIWG